jgi:hypothetical protein
MELVIIALIAVEVVIVRLPVYGWSQLPDANN